MLIKSLIPALSEAHGPLTGTGLGKKLLTRLLISFLPFSNKPRYFEMSGSPSPTPSKKSGGLAGDEAELARMGYKQELK